MRRLDEHRVPLEAYDAALACGDTETIKSLVLDMLDDGRDPVSVLTDVVAAKQREVGRRWQLGEYTVAQEHAATAVAISATKIVAAHVGQVPVTRGKVLVACAEREWHALPAMMIECALRAHGWDTTLLGASTNPMRLNQYLHDLGPDAVAVSCSVLGSLPTCRRFIEATTASGTPILVGGPAFGADDVRAIALGATAWAGDAHGAVLAMDGLPAVVEPAPPLSGERIVEQAALESDHRRLVGVLRERWTLVAAATTPDADCLNSVIDVADDVLHQTLHAVEVALLTGDVRVLPETAWWIDDLLGTRGADPTMMGELVDILTAAMRDYPMAAALMATHFVVPMDWRQTRATAE
ncbi:cobalamin B12-binding domain-containing protein [Mycobacterium yunnanensis]|uniref:Cobalamin B12-binding domain-containing protein n=1 Tax=Mycobacterium yunnanensis TaxID=368477 RepID=A0A9X2YXC2_9MYCO|nr:cobalamin-dependent protein [Mycobacterium yunnanensis]MCV7419476.1 cobalamin B12-binding domain-containing protein [Mycobacterium yunnanensis]